MFIVICYDIPSDQRRNQIAKTLKGFGYRVQESVFECEVTVEELKKLQQRIQQRIIINEDSVRYYNLCAECIKKIEIKGLGEVKRSDRFFVI